MKRFAPATERNSTPILEVLQRVLPRRGQVLEIASGTGQHAVFFAPIFKTLTWQPTDADPEVMASINAWIDDAGTPNIARPILLDVTNEDWPITHADAIVCCNMIHISPWQACEGLMAGARKILPKDGSLFLYGPFLEDDAETSASNLAFDASLKTRNPAWGIRSLEDVKRLASANGLRLLRRVAMPANNLSLIFVQS